MVDTADIHSVTGEVVQLSCIAIPLTPRQFSHAFRAGDVRWLEDKIEAGIGLASQLGASIVGLGGYTSIISGQGTHLRADRALTTGNALTVGMGVQALRDSARERGIELRTATLGALGATGNICGLYADLMADVVPRIVLIGRPGMQTRLDRVADEIYAEAFEQIEEKPAAIGGVAAHIENTRTIRDLVHSKREGRERLGARIRTGLCAEMGTEAPIQTSSDARSLQSCNLIVSASSDPDPVIYPEHLGGGPIVICDIAVPEDTSPRVLTERPDVSVIRGGIVRLPQNPSLRLAGLALESGCVFACMAETILLGLARVTEHFSFGRITRRHVQAINNLATRHGFLLSRAAIEKSL